MVTVAANAAPLRAQEPASDAAFDSISYHDSGGFAGGGTGKWLSVTADGRIEAHSRGGDKFLSQLRGDELAELKKAIAAVDWPHVEHAYQLRGAADLVIRDLVVVVHGTSYQTHFDGLFKLPAPLRAVFDRLDDFYQRALKPVGRPRPGSDPIRPVEST
jgi:hypothetical protein